MANIAGGSIVWNLDIDDKKFKSKLASNSAAIKSVSKDIDSEGGSIASKLGGVFAKVGSALFTAVKIGTVAAGAALTGLGVFGIKTAGDLQKTALSMQALVGSTEAGNKAFSEAYQYALKSPFAFPEVASSVKTMLAFGLSADQANGALETLGNVSIVTGADLGSLANIFGRAGSQGKLMLQDIRQLTENGVGILPALQKELGKTTAEVEKMATNGEIDFATFEKALGRIADPSVLEKLNNTLPRQLDRLQGSIRSVALAFVGVSLTDGFTMATDGLQQAAINLVKNLADTLRTPGITDTIGALGTKMAGVVNSLTPLINALLPVILSLADVLVGAFAAVVPALASFLTAAAPGIKVFFDSLAKAIEILAPYLEQFATIMGGVLSDVLTALAPILPSLAEVVGLLALAFAEVVKAAVPFVTAVINAITPYLPQIVDGFKQILTALLPLLPTFTELLIALVPLIPPLIELAIELMPILIYGIKALVAAIKILGPALIAYVKDNVEKIVGVITFLKDIVSGLKDSFKTTVDGSILAFNILRDGIINAINWINNGIVNFVLSAHSRFNDFMNTVRAIPGNIAGSIGNLGNLLYNAGRDLIQGLISGAGSLLSRLGSFFLDKVPGPLKDAFRSALGIRSPSKVFAEYGVDIMRGLVVGVSKGIPLATNAIDKASESLSSEFSSISGMNMSLAPNIATEGYTGATRKQYVVNVTQNNSGIVAQSRSAWREINKDGLEAVNEELRSKGLPEIGGGMLSTGGSTV